MDLLTGAGAIDRYSQILRTKALAQVGLKPNTKENLQSEKLCLCVQHFKSIQCNEGSGLNRRASPQKANRKMAFQLLEKTPKLCSEYSGYMMKP